MTKKLARLLGLKQKVIAYQEGRNKPHPSTNKIIMSPSPIANLMGPGNPNMPTCSRLNCYRVSELNNYKSRDRLSSSYDQFNDEVNNSNIRSENDKTDIQNDWKLCAIVFDRLLFWIFALLTLSSSLTILFITPLFNYVNHKTHSST
jgi:hypothetical protein